MMKKAILLFALCAALAPAAFAAITLDGKPITTLSLSTSGGNVIITSDAADSAAHCDTTPTPTDCPGGAAYCADSPLDPACPGAATYCVDNPDPVYTDCPGGANYCAESPLDPACPGAETYCSENPGYSECPGAAAYCAENPEGPGCPPVDICGTEGQELVFETRDWVNQGGQTRLDLGRTGTATEKMSSKITTTLSTTYGGQIELGPTTGTGDVGRRVWISTCPGGPPIDKALETDYCNLRDTEIFLKWAQADIPGRCYLETDTVYYINYKNLNCTSSVCSAYRNLRNNGEP